MLAFERQLTHHTLTTSVDNLIM
uniref:Uncharacterized protein n=1 Tax=Arundo donax TaxID=35708 RepID=A0A0A9BBA8_ARUDO